MHEQTAARRRPGERDGEDRGPAGLADERPQIDGPGLEALAGEGGVGGQRHGLLGDPAARGGHDVRARLLQFLLGGVRADDDAVAAEAVDRLDHQFGEVVEDVGALVGVAARVRADGRQQGRSPR